MERSRIISGLRESATLQNAIADQLEGDNQRLIDLEAANTALLKGNEDLQAKVNELSKRVALENQTNQGT